MLAAVDRDGDACDALRLRQIKDRGGDVLRARPMRRPPPVISAARGIACRTSSAMGA
jgi:hypothetical protein